ncbi:ATP-binding cassette domain-containing protein [Candidatus Sumerlaeota bacterium]|nr:ATP-binding cassette domain-containing protein [Candidatus Sumerlaeota bacterium]
MKSPSASPSEPIALDAPSEASSPSSNPAIEAEMLTKNYGSRRVVDRLSFSIDRGEILGLLGPNGAGKTTTMRILAGYTPATSGHAAIMGHDVAADSFEARRNLGYLPENTPLYGEMKVGEYLKFMAELKRCPRHTIAKAVGQAVEECGLTDVIGRIIGTLSKGYRQRVGLAQAVLADPPVLILDEPTVGLDPRQIADIRHLIKGMAGRRTILLSTHILPEVSMTCSRVIVLDQGKVAASGTPQKLVSGIQRDAPILVTITGDANKARELLEKVEGVISVDHEMERSGPLTALRVHPSTIADPRAAISKALVEAGFGLAEISRSGVSLEDVFLRVIASAGREDRDV